MLFKKFDTKIMRNIVYRFTPQRSPYDKTSYIENYIPRPNKYHKTRKPRLSQWTDPKVQWPLLLPQATKQQGKSLIHHLEHIEKKRILSKRMFRVGSVRAGDVIKFTYYHSLSEKKFNVYSGLVIGKSNRKSLDASIRVIFRFCGSHVEMNLKQNSPFLSDFKILARGRGHRRAKWYHLGRMGMTKEELLRPITKGRNEKERIRNKEIPLEIENKSLKVDKTKDPLFKKL